MGRLRGLKAFSSKSEGMPLKMRALPASTSSCVVFSETLIRRVSNAVRAAIASTLYPPSAQLSATSKGPAPPDEPPAELLLFDGRPR
eukprot:1661534-Prymnesium_polylepis.1